MSYSLATQRGANKALVLAALAAAFDAQVVANQPAHAHDRDAHLANAERQLSVLPDEPGEGNEFTASMSGWLSWSKHGEDGKPDPASFTAGGCTVTVGIQPVEAPKA